ncbi:uncharacterized protein EI97DRAFT_215735 [Westerdykella ornata]|uniref:Uncharacterized protein n=1 Tax=Westerdykella ornata TaxID=318751 RepID=A0A6A6JQX5_WESOR|nr:uncharacterized protein EI97DRAFT_215735 [Westerdykella ornata]KAF2278644.1 hypothetical protein EI97DRAFT_215735 [Westerdykella ornata]
MCLAAFFLPFPLLIFAFLTCMLAALYRARASPRLPPQASSPILRPVHSHSKYGYLATRPHSTIMFKKAVAKENASPVAVKAVAQQRTLLSSFRHTGSTQSSTSRPLSVASANIVRESERRTSAGYGAKRTSSGLVKALEPQENFEYPPLSISGNNSSRTSVETSAAIGEKGIVFDENDFDSDIDLDVEDLATKDTVKYPTLPQSPNNHKPRDSGYGFVDLDNGLEGLDSSLPVPWSSSPVEHFQPPPVRPAQPTKRRTLPWLEKGSQIESSKQLEDSPEPESTRSKKRRLPESGDATPKPKDATREYPWNTTASAVKQQQKSLREAKKALTKTNTGDEEEKKKAIAQKKKNTVHRIFLSEEQQHVLQLVTEYKKSVFFTGSAG